MKIVLTSVVLTVIAVFGATNAGASTTKTCIEDNQCAFVQEYIRELYEFQKLIVEAKHDQAHLEGDKNVSQLTNAVHGSTRFIQEATTDIGMLKNVHVSDPDVVNMLVENYELEIQMHTRLIEISRTFLSGPKPGVDYGNLLADVTQMRASLESINGQAMNMSNLVFATALIAKNKQDKAGHVELCITNAERQELVKGINNLFGDHLNHLGNNANWTENAAWVLRAQLMKEFTASDDPKA